MTREGRRVAGREASHGRMNGASRRLALLLMIGLTLGSAAHADGTLAVGLVGFSGTTPEDWVHAQALEAALRDRGARKVTLAPTGSIQTADEATTPRQVRRAVIEMDVDALILTYPDTSGRPDAWIWEIRSGHSGGVMGVRTASTRVPEGKQQLKSAADWIARVLSLSPLAPVKSDLSSEVGPTDSGTLDVLFGRGLEVEEDLPMTIESEELRLVTGTNESRHLHFIGSVVAVQGDRILRARELEAFYPPHASEPDRLVARGNVEFEQTDLTAQCDRAEYLRVPDILKCEGHAELYQGCDLVRGESIEFDLRNNRAHVEGSASVVIHPDAAKDRPSCHGGGT